MPDTAPLIDLEDVARLLGLPAARAETFLTLRREFPVATYHGRPLWLSDTVHALVAEAPCAHG